MAKKTTKKAKPDVAKIKVQCFGNVPKRGTTVAAGWDVNPISVKEPRAQAPYTFPL